MTSPKASYVVLVALSGDGMPSRQVTLDVCWLLASYVLMVVTVAVLLSSPVS